MKESSLVNRATVFGICVLLAGITWFVFAQTLNYPFVNYDDTDYVLKNHEVVRGFTTEGIIWAFTQVHASNWHPLTWLSHMLDCQLYGLRAGGHHLTNLLLHTATVVLLFLVLRNMTASLWRSAFVAAVFAIHPLRVESVAWISERKDVLSGLLFVLTIGAYSYYARHPSRSRYLLLLFLFSLGLMSKPMLVTVPLVLLLLDYWPLRRLPNESISPRLIWEKVPLFLFAALSSLATLFAQKATIQPVISVPLPLRIGNALISYVTYLHEMFWPSDLAALYPLTQNAVNTTTVVLSLVVLIAISLLVFRAREQRYLLTGWLWYVIMLLPVIGIIQVGIQAHADRYTYLPQIGIYLLLTWAAADFLAQWRSGRLLLGAIAAVIIASLAINARTQASYWESGEKLWRAAIAHTPANAVAHVYLGEALYEQGRLDEAITEYQTHLDSNPMQALAYSALGAALLEAGQPDQSIVNLERALRLAPGFEEAHYNLGNTFLQAGRAKEAIEHYNKALELDPSDLEAQNNLAWLLATSPAADIRDGSKAVALAERADTLTGGKSQILSATLAAAYAESGRFSDAIKAAERAWSLAMAEGNRPRAESIHEQLEHYRSGSAFRDNRFTSTSR